MRTITASGGARPTGTNRLRLLVLASGAAISAGSMASPASAGDYVYNRPIGSIFNFAGNWEGGVVPPSNDPTTTLTFAPTTIPFTPSNVNASTNITQDLVAGFLVNSITFANANYGTNITATNAFASALKFVGPSASINLNGMGSASIAGNNAAPYAQLGANLTIGGTGIEILSLGGLTDDGGARSVTIAPLAAPLLGTPASQIFRTVIFGGSTNTYTGGLTLDGGNMATGGNGLNNGPNTFGTAGTTFHVTANGGVVQLTSSTQPVAASTFQIDGTLKIVGSQVLTLNMPTTSTLLTGSGALVMNGSGSVTVSSNSTGYTGAVTIDRSSLPQFTSSFAGGITLSSIAGANVTNGALLNVPSFDIRSLGTLTLDNSVANSLQNGDRIGDTVPINLRSGNFTLNGPAALGAAAFTPANLNETVGAIGGAGYSTFTVTPSDLSVSTTLTGASLARVNQGTFLFHGTSFGAGTAGSGNAKFTSAPTADLVGGGGGAGTTTISILPYAIGDTVASNNGLSLVTYDANGVRPLASSEYAADLVSGATTNAMMGMAPNTAVTIAAPATVNALVLNATSAVALDGIVMTGSPVNLTSGVLLFTTLKSGVSAGGLASIANTINFGPAEGQIFTSTTGSASAILTINGSLVGSNGLTKSGNGNLTLKGDNSGLTGALTINSGILNFNSALALPGNTSIRAGSGASLAYSGAAPLNMARDIAIDNGMFLPSSTTAGQTLTLSGTISGAGGINIITTGDVVLSGNNTYTGPTALSSGITHISSDANLGNGGAVNLGGGTLMTDGNWTTGRMVNISAASTINTNGNNVTLNGPLTNSGIAFGLPVAQTLTKTGAGTLTINSNLNTFIGAMTISGAGSNVLVNGTIAASSANSITVNTGATLGGSGTIFRNITVASGGKLSPGNSPGILTENGNLTLASGSNFLVDLNGPAAGNGLGDYDQMVVQGGGTVTMTGSNCNLVISLGYTPASTDEFFILTKDGTAFITGAFAGLPQGSYVSLGTFAGSPLGATISYRGNVATGATLGGNDVVLFNIVPAPGAVGLLAFGGLIALRRRR